MKVLIVLVSFSFITATEVYAQEVGDIHEADPNDTQFQEKEVGDIQEVGDVQEADSTDPQFQEKEVGDIREADPNDTQYQEKAQNVLESFGFNTQVTDVLSVKTQIVDGIKYYIKVLLDNGMMCDLTFVEQEWISPEPIQKEYACIPHMESDEDVEA